jgi:hypothetical protein
MAGSTCSFLSGAALCLYAVLSHLYRSAFPIWAVVIVTVVGVGMIFVGLFQLMIERWGMPLEPPEKPSGDDRRS